MELEDFCLRFWSLEDMAYSRFLDPRGYRYSGFSSNEYSMGMVRQGGGKDKFFLKS